MPLLTAELAGVARYHAAVERRLFEVLGGWVPAVADPELKAFLRVESFRHAWHASLWDEVVPRAPVEPAAVADREVERLVGGLTVDQVGDVYRVVLPALVAAYRGLARDGEEPVARAVGLMISDDEQSIRRARSVLKTDGGSPPDSVE